MMKACMCFRWMAEGTQVSEPYSRVREYSLEHPHLTKCFELLPAPQHCTRNWGYGQLCWYANWSLCPMCGPGWWCCQDTWTPPLQPLGPLLASDGQCWGRTARILVFLLLRIEQPQNRQCPMTSGPTYVLQSIHRVTNEHHNIRSWIRELGYFKWA